MCCPAGTPRQDGTNPSKLFYVTEMTILYVIDKSPTRSDSPVAFTSHKLILLCHLVNSTWGGCISPILEERKPRL